MRDDIRARREVPPPGHVTFRLSAVGPRAELWPEAKQNKTEKLNDDQPGEFISSEYKYLNTSTLRAGNAEY